MNQGDIPISFDVYMFVDTLRCVGLIPEDYHVQVGDHWTEQAGWAIIVQVMLRKLKDTGDDVWD